jgi:hypothetical protein
MGGLRRSRIEAARMATPTAPARWPEFKAWLLDDLTDDERRYVRAWMLRYVNRWGQVPVAASRNASKAYTQRRESNEP